MIDGVSGELVGRSFHILGIGRGRSLGWCVLENDRFGAIGVVRDVVG